MNTRSPKQQEASMRNLAKGEQKQFNEAANFGFAVGVGVVSFGVLLGIVAGEILSVIFR